MRKIILVFICLLFAVPSQAATITVDDDGPADYDNIRAAINAATAGDTVLVAPGTYTGPGNRGLNFYGKAITVRSTEPNDPAVVAETVIDCQEATGGLGFTNNEQSNSVLAGLTIINVRFHECIWPFFPQGVISCVGSSPTIRNCIIKYCSADLHSCSPRGAITCRDGSAPTITHCIIYQNASDGVYCENSSPTIKSCIISENAETGIYCSESSSTISNCIISENPGGIYCRGGSSHDISDCIIKGSSNHGVYVECYGESSQLTISNCTISGNSCGTWVGGGICCDGVASTTITNCLISNNSAEGEYAYGGGIFYFGGGNHTISNCVISGNKATWGGGIDCGYSSSPIITNCTITGNIAEDSGGGIQPGRDASPILANCILWGNTASRGKQIAVGHPDRPWDSSLTISYSNVQGGQDEVYISPDSELNWDDGNIESDPCFVEAGYWDANGAWVEGNYHLLEDSPCIDTGDPNYIPEPNETDLDGNPRVIGYAVDMGAYEYWPPVEAEMTLTPKALNCNSKGNWVKAHFTLPDEFLPEDVDVNEPAWAEPIDLESEYIKLLGSNKGPVKLEIAFNRETFCDAITEPGQLDVTIIGSLTTGQRFFASDSIKIIPHR